MSRGRAMATPTRPMTAEAFALLPDDGDRCELVKGMVRRTSPVGFLPGNLAARLTARLVVVADEYGSGEITVADVKYVLARSPDTVRAPGVAFVGADRMPTAENQRRFAELAPNPAVAVIPPSAPIKDIDEKVGQHLALGVPLVREIQSKRRTVTVHPPGGEAQALRDGDRIDGGDLLPGFRLPVSEVRR